MTRLYHHHDTPLHAIRKELVPKATEALWSAFNFGDYTAFTDVLITAAQASASTLIRKASPANEIEQAINDEAYDWALNHAGDLVGEIDAKTNAAIARITAQAFKQGWTDQQVAAALAKLPGLDETFVDSVDNFRNTMINQGRTPAAAEVAAGNFADQLRYNRAQTIAQTEVSAALNEGQRIVWRDADNNGQLPPMVRRQWMLDPTELTCHICTKLDGTVTTLDSDFGPNADWAPPLHPNCNCTEQLLDLENNVLDSPDDFSKGDTPGHEFHGNQYTAVGGSLSGLAAAASATQTLDAFKTIHEAALGHDELGSVADTLSDHPRYGNTVTRTMVNQAHSQIKTASQAALERDGFPHSFTVYRNGDTSRGVVSVSTEPNQTFNPQRPYTVSREHVLTYGSAFTTANTFTGEHELHVESNNLKSVSQREVLKGDTPGHEFHGNQWTAVGSVLDTSRTTLRSDEEMPTKIKNVQDRGTEMSTEAVQQRLAHYVGASILGGTMEEDKHWFDQQHAVIGQLADKYNMDPTTLAAMIASTSPLTAWEANVPKALLAAKISDEFPNISTRALARETESPGMIASTLEKAIGLYRGEITPDQALQQDGSPKTTSFFNNLSFPQEKSDRSVTVDTHLAQALLGNASAPKQDVKALTSGRGYAWSADQLREAARRYGMQPLELQSVIWTQMARGY